MRWSVVVEIKKSYLLVQWKTVIIVICRYDFKFLLSANMEQNVQEKFTNFCRTNFVYIKMPININIVENYRWCH